MGTADTDMISIALVFIGSCLCAWSMRRIRTEQGFAWEDLTHFRSTIFKWLWKLKRTPLPEKSECSSHLHKRPQQCSIKLQAGMSQCSPSENWKKSSSKSFFGLMMDMMTKNRQRGKHCFFIQPGSAVPKLQPPYSAGPYIPNNPGYLRTPTLVCDSRF